MLGWGIQNTPTLRFFSLKNVGVGYNSSAKIFKKMWGWGVRKISVPPTTIKNGTALHASPRAVGMHQECRCKIRPGKKYFPQFSVFFPVLGEIWLWDVWWYYFYVIKSSKKKSEFTWRISIFVSIYGEKYQYFFQISVFFSVLGEIWPWDVWDREGSQKT